MKVYKQIIEMLVKNGAKHRVVPHAAEGRCDVISQIRGNKLSQAMKAIVVKAQMSKKHSDYYLVVVPGDMSLDMDALKAHTKAPQVFFAPKEKAVKLTDCEMGAIPPFSFNRELKVIADPAIKNNDEIVFNAGLLDQSIFMSTVDFVRLANPVWAAVGKMMPPAPKAAEEVKREVEDAAVALGNGGPAAAKVNLSDREASPLLILSGGLESRRPSLEVQAAAKPAAKPEMDVEGVAELCKLSLY